MFINRIQADLLEHIGRFGFLAVSQCVLLTGKSTGYLREMLGSLSRRGYLKSYRVEVAHKVRAENIYYLTEVAKEFLLSHKNVFADDIKLPVGTPVVVRDYFHRYHFVSVHIALYQHLQGKGISIDSFLTYFDRVGAARKGTLTAKTKIPLDDKGKETFIPDGVMIAGSRLYLIEMFCDKDTKRILATLATHARAISSGTPGKVFDMEMNPIVLSVFENEGTKNAVIKRLSAIPNFQPLKGLYFFATLETLKQSCRTAFQTITEDTLVFMVKTKDDETGT